MDPKKRERDVEQWLDSALSQYSKAEPRTGLESRVLANLQAERNRIASQKNWWRAMGTVAAAVVIAAGVWVGDNGRKKNAGGVAETSTPIHEEAQRSIEPRPSQQAVHPAKEAAQRKPANQPSRELAVAAAPKLEQFPSRRNMSEGERLLLRRLNEQSNQEALLESTPSREAVDLSIGSLEIRPLQVPDIEISESKTN